MVGEARDKLVGEGLFRWTERLRGIQGSAAGVTVVLTAQWTLLGLSIRPAEVGTRQIRAESEALVRDAPAFIRGMRKLSGITDSG